MKQAKTIVNHLLEKLHEQPPFTNLYLTIRPSSTNMPSGFYSGDRCSPDDFAAVLFDLSIAGYYINNVESFIYGVYYTIEMCFELSKRLKTNIDASVVQEVVKIAEKAIKSH